MPAVRLVFLVALVVGVLVAVAASTSTTRERTDGVSTGAIPAAPAAGPTKTIDAKAPTAEPIVARVGDTVALTVTLDRSDAVVLNDFGFDENVAQGVPTQLLFTAIAEGRFPIVQQSTGKRIAVLVVKAARSAKPSGGTIPAPANADAPASV